VAIRQVTLSPAAKSRVVAKALEAVPREWITPGQLRAIVENVRPRPPA
jgi:hypothetical protein